MNARNNTLEIIANPAPITAKMPFETQVKNLATLIKAKPESSRVIEFTPELAEHILATQNNSNRPMKMRNIKLYADSLRAGQWGLTGDTIKFAPDGTLRDGQNRLAAVIRAGVPLRTHTVFGIDAELFTRMDIGKNRSAADVFHIAGFQYAAPCAATVRWLLILESGNPKNRAANFTNDELLDAFKNRYDPLAVEEAVRMAQEVKAATGAPVASTAALYYLMRQADAAKATEFMLMWRDGKGSPRSPTRMLQAALKAILDATNGRIHEVVRNALIVKAWQAFRDGKQLKKDDLAFDLAEEDFPSIA